MVVVVVGGPPDLIWVAVMAAELTAGQAGHQTESLCRSLGGPACLAVAWLLYQTVKTRNYNFTTCREETGELRFFYLLPGPRFNSLVATTPTELTNKTTSKHLK